MTDRRDSSNTQGRSFFQGATRTRITGGTFVSTHNHTTHVVDPARGPLSLLYDEVAHNAILNAGGRADEVRCHPGTREEVLSKTKKWRDDGPDRMFWLSGPAGAGKSAIIQTFAEDYITPALIMINFFFFRADRTRNHLAPIVATLLFQLLGFYPGAESHISAVLAKMPYIFKKSIRDQFLHLIINPINYLRDLDNDSRPIVLLVDGLDECDTEKSQTTLVRILDDLVSIMGSPFKVLVSCRKEPHLTMAFNQIQSTIGSIFLDDDYQPQEDIRRYVTDELVAIKRAHHLAHTLPFDWPSEENIEYIVEKSSGQFNYAATVVRFISSSPPSPARSLDQIMGIRPAKRNSPFAALDAVYIHILDQVDDWDAVKDILSAQIIASNISWSLRIIINPLRYTEDDITTHTANLGALMKIDLDNITFYHASFVDFLTDATRSGNLFLDIYAFTADLTAAHFSNVMYNDEFHLENTLDIARWVTVSSPALEDALAAFSPQDIMFEEDNSFGAEFAGFLYMLNQMYSESNERLYVAILRKWLPYFRKNNYTAQELRVASINLGLEIWEEISEEIPRSDTGRLETAQSEQVLSENVQSETGQSSKKRHSVSRVFKRLFKKS